MLRRRAGLRHEPPAPLHTNPSSGDLRLMPLESCGHPLGHAWPQVVLGYFPAETLGIRSKEGNCHPPTCLTDGSDWFFLSEFVLPFGSDGSDLSLRNFLDTGQMSQCRGSFSEITSPQINRTLHRPKSHHGRGVAFTLFFSDWFSLCGVHFLLNGSYLCQGSDLSFGLMA